MGIATVFRIMRKSIVNLYKKKEITERYPDPIARKVLPRRSRGYLSVDIYKCSLCSKCSLVCPSCAIDVNARERSLDLDFTKCMFCGYCVEICPEQAILFSHGFEGATLNKSNFVYRFLIRNPKVYK